MDRDLLRITDKVATFIARSDAGGKPDEFNTLSLEVFEHQYRMIEPYRKLCQYRGKTPETVQNWTDIPAVAADAFKHFFLFSGEAEDVRKTFKSSGTTQPGSSSQAHFSDAGLQLMNLAVDRNAREMLFPDARRTRILVLAPKPELASHMIMVHGMNHLISKFGAEGSRFCVGADGLQTDSLITELKTCTREKIPVTLMGSSFGFVHLFDQMDQMGLKLELPEGSRLMDAGGYKGRSREIARDAFVEWACSLLGLPPEHVVNLLGMTEIASQIYDGVWNGGFRMKKPPHWVRTQVVDPSRLRKGDPEVVTQTDQPGLLRHLDLANVERPMAVLSEDIGIRRGEGFDVLRRAKGAEPRGCSLSMEEFAARRT